MIPDRQKGVNYFVRDFKVPEHGEVGVWSPKSVIENEYQSQRIIVDFPDM